MNVESEEVSKMVFIQNRPEKEHYELPRTLIEKAECFKINNQISLAEIVQIFTKSLNKTTKQINNVKKLTSKQNINTAHVLDPFS